MKKWLKLKAVLFVIFTAMLIRCSFIVSSVPDEIILYKGEKLNFSKALSVSVKADFGGKVRKNQIDADTTYTADVKLCGVVPVKTVKVSVKEMPEVVPGGESIGVKLSADGLMVVGISDFASSDGQMISPAKKSGIRAGDIVKTVNGKAVEKAKDFSKSVEERKGEAVEVTVTRDGEPHSYTITPCCDANGELKLGMWVRSSVAGIGTMTFYNPASKTYGALGHGIADSDTEQIVPLGSGEVLKAEILSVVKGERGAPGELRGSFSLDEEMGNVQKNTQCGIYGKVTDETLLDGKLLKTAPRTEVKEGKAQILTSVDGEEIRSYDIEIQRVSERKNAETKCMVIKVTDKKLLAQTGGILQGMSGSPIIQNEKLVGAVTHVFVNDPTRGYGIFIENMLEEAESIKN